MKNHLINAALIFGAFLVFWYIQAGSAADNRDTRKDFCVEVEQVRTFARDAATRSLSSLPTIAYYKSHPKELEAAVKNLKGQVDFFSPALDCDKFAKS